MKRVLIFLYPFMDRFYHYWGYARLALCAVIIICALLTIGLHLWHSSLQLSYSFGQGPSDPIGGGH